MRIQPGWVFHMVKQSQIIPTLKKSNVSKTIFRDSMRCLCQMVTGMIRKSCFKWASDGFCLLHPFNHAPAELGLFIFYFNLADPENPRGLCADFYHGFGPTPNHFLCLGRWCFIQKRALQLRSKHVYTICFQASSIDIFDMVMSESITAPGICKSTMVGALEAAARTNFSPCNPIANFPKMTRPHNLRIVVEPPAPFLGF